jgi:DNA-binding response OmpR family regulator
VLIVDDDRVIRMVVRDALLSAGYEVVEAADAPTGIDQALELRPDLIILDVMLPRVDGLAMLADLRERKVESNVLVFSATGSRNAERAHELGASGYLSKPFDLEELLDRVRVLTARDVA